MLRLIILCFLLSCTTLGSAQVVGDTTRLYFDLDVDSLSNTSRQKLSVFLRNIDRNKNVVIIGYTDYLGTEDYNIVLSKERARNVAYYLLEHEVSDQNITVCMGRGKIERKGMTRSAGYPTDRRVDIVLVDKAHKPVIRDSAKRKPPLRKDPMDVNVTVKPGSGNPVPDDMKNIPLYREAPKNTPKPPGTSYSINDSGNIYVVMRPGGEKSEIPPQIKNAGPDGDAKDPYKNKNELDLTNIKAGETLY